ncbi:hypothetical protein ACEF17_11970, partial [Streptococcus hyovaginalis]
KKEKKKIIEAGILKEMDKVKNGLNLGWFERKVKTTKHRALKLLKKNLVVISSPQGNRRS